jgi:hypothetical protein
MDGSCSTNGENRNAYRILVGKPDVNRSVERPRRRWVDNIKMDLREIELSGMDWIGSVQDRYKWRALVNTEMNLRVLQNFKKFLGSCTTGSFTSRAQLHGVSCIRPSFFACPQMSFLYNFVLPKLLVYNSSYTQSIIHI